jgi:hypothetical protein
MENLKLDELICLTGWSAAFADGQKDSSESNATEKEKNIVRAMRAFFKMDVDRFNKSNQKYETLTGHLIELKDKDPITKIVARYSALKVAHAENEDGKNQVVSSDKEWEFILKIDDITDISLVRADIKSLSMNLINEMCAPEFLIDNDLLDLVELEKEDGTLYRRCIQPLLKAFFNSLEKNDFLDTWEENYLALIKYKTELQDMFGKMDLKEFETRYKELKPLISNLKKEKVALEKVLAKLKADKEKQLAKELADQEKQLAKEKAELEKNKTHEYSVSNGIHYCRYCGKDKSWNRFDCTRENGHKYSVKRIKKSSNYSGDYFEYVPICNNCGHNNGFSKFKCK